MPTILEVDGLVKTFGDYEAVKGVSFSVGAGEEEDGYPAGYGHRLLRRRCLTPAVRVRGSQPC